MLDEIGVERYRVRRTGDRAGLWSHGRGQVYGAMGEGRSMGPWERAGLWGHGRGQVHGTMEPWERAGLNRVQTYLK